MTLKMIVTHPDNVRELERLLLRDRVIADRLSMLALKVVPDKAMPRFGPAKRVRLPDGRIVDRDTFVWRTRLITYEKQDLLYLMWAGVIKEQLEPLYYLMDEPTRFFAFDFGMIPQPDRRVLLRSSIV